MHFLDGEDCMSTLHAFESMGVKYELSHVQSQFDTQTKKLVVHGVGMNGLKESGRDIDCGNSGTTMRLLLGLLSGQKFRTRLIGDPSLSKRPMKRVTDPLRKMGAKIFGAEDANYAPLIVEGAPLSGIELNNSIASAQVKSAILLAGLYARGSTKVLEQRPTRDHTERLLTLFGAQIEQTENKIYIRKAKELKPISFEIPGDFSSAAFFIAAALIVPGSKLRILNVGLNATRIGLFPVLKAMGANIQIEEINNQKEPSGILVVKASELSGITLDKNTVPMMIDEIPILMILCALAKGRSVIRGVEELRVKESDRIRSMAAGLRAIGAQVEELSDGCIIEGMSEFRGGRLSSFKDHRVAMSFMVAGLKSREGVKVEESDCIAISYPQFEADLKRAFGNS